MKKLLLVVMFLFISASCFANNYGIENSSNRLYITVTGESNGLTHYSWSISNTSQSGINSIEIPEEVENKEQFIAQYGEGWIITIIIEDEEED